MAEITHADLMALAKQIDESQRYAFGQFSEAVRDDFRQVHARVSELRDNVATQNSRVHTAEQDIGRLNGDVRTLRHDLDGHVDAHDKFSAVVERLKAPAPSGVSASSGSDAKPSKAFVAGVTAAVLALAGAANVVLEWLPDIIKRWKP